MEAGEHQHKVRFDQNEDSNPISVEKQLELENSFTVHLGFLKINHHYKIEFPISKLQFTDPKALEKFDIATIKKQPNCQLVGLVSNSTEFLFQVQLYAYTESVLKEKITFSDIELTFVAQVLGKNKGTPLLKDGIHILHVSHQPIPSNLEDSDSS